MKKKLLAIHLNEFNLQYLIRGSKKYNTRNLKKILELNKITTTTKDKEQNKNLDPWVQGVSINTGKNSKSHKIFNLGQKIPNKQIQIWDKLSKKKISCGIWGTMNSKYNKNENIKIYFPDPWNFRDGLHPKKLKYLFYLPSYYSKNYLNYSKTKIFFLSVLFLYGVIINNSFWFLLKNFFLFFKFILKRGLKNYILFFIFDLISLNIVSELNKKKKLDFLMIFLNSLAHFQHNNWDEKNNEKDYFVFVNEICKLILKIQKNYDSLIIFNGFTQKKIKTEYLIRPTDPKKFLQNLGINFHRFEQDMTNGAFIFFNDNKSLNKSFKKLNNYKFFGLNVFLVKKVSKKSIFYKFRIKFLKNNFVFDDFKERTIKNITDYYISKKIYFDTNYTEKEFTHFISQISLIKTTGVHSPDGHLLYKNIKMKNKQKPTNLQNHKIFDLIKNFFS